MTKNTRPTMTRIAIIPGLRDEELARRFELELEELEDVLPAPLGKLKPPPTSAKKATAASLRNVCQRNGRVRTSLVRSRAGPMASLALSGLMAGQKESSTGFVGCPDLFAGRRRAIRPRRRGPGRTGCGGALSCRGYGGGGLLRAAGAGRR